MKNSLLTKLFDLTGRVALVTGASRGLGKATAIGLGDVGAELIICSRQHEALEDAAQEIREKTHTKVTTIVTDLTKRSKLLHLTNKALNVAGRIDILVCNAGVDHPEKLEQVDDKTWDHDLELNLTSCMMLTRTLAPQMKEHHWGRIIYISSILGMTGRKGRATYSASKAALIGLARSVAIELGPYNVTVNCIAPGPFNVKTPYEDLSHRQKNNFKRWTVLERWGKPEEIIGTILLLSSKAGSYITGSTIVVDGGVLCKSFE